MRGIDQGEIWEKRERESLRREHESDFLIESAKWMVQRSAESVRNGMF